MTKFVVSKSIFEQYTNALFKKCLGLRGSTNIAMNMNLLSILTFSLTLTFAVAEIKLVNVLFRHGDRTPGNFIKSCPNCCDPHIYTNDFFPIGLGGLTNEGKQRIYKLGKFLRTLYDNFLGVHYVPKNVEAVSSDSPRTRMSLQLLLAGLYPPAQNQTWNEQIPWQPALTSYTPRAQDTIFVPQMCEEYEKEYRSVLNSPEFKQHISKLDAFLAKLQVDMGKNQECSLIDANHLYHTFDAQKAAKFALPDWANAIYPDGDLREGALLQYRLYGYNNKLKRLAGGYLLKKMINDMKKTMEKKHTEQLHLYSGHELNIVMFLQTLGLYDNLMPEYSSAVIVELHEIKGQYFVKVLYYHGIPMKVSSFQIPGCAKTCPIEQFVQLLQPVIPTDEDLNCRRIPAQMGKLLKLIKHKAMKSLSDNF